MTEIELKARLSRNLHKYRKEQGFTQEELAEKAGISLAGYKNYESGKHGISLDMLAKLGNALGVDPANLLAADDADQSMSNIRKLLQNKPKSFIMAVEEITRALLKVFESKGL